MHANRRSSQFMKNADVGYNRYVRGDFSIQRISLLEQGLHVMLSVFCQIPCFEIDSLKQLSTCTPLQFTPDSKALLDTFSVWKKLHKL
jgi:hypothetical protein